MLKLYKHYPFPDDEDDVLELLYCGISIAVLMAISYIIAEVYL